VKGEDGEQAAATPRRHPRHVLNEFWSEIRYRLRAIFRRAALERELDAELRFHVEREAEKQIARGLSSDDALRRARLTFGGIDRIKDDDRDARGVAAVEHIIRDLRYALRGLRSRPLFTAVVIATLGLGVGVNAAMFGVLDRTLVRAPRYLRHPGDVRRLYVEWTANDGKRMTARRLEYPRYADIVKWSRTANIAAFAYRRAAVGDGENTRELQVGAVSGTFFDFFDARPVLGRFFGVREDQPPFGESVAVLSFEYWQSRYAGRADAIGSTLRIGTATYTVIGVAPRGFDGVSDGRAPVVFIPVAAFGASSRPNYYNRYNWSWLEILVRLRPEASLDIANADLTSAVRRSWLVEGAPESVRPIAIAAPLQLARGPMAGPETKVVVWIGGVAIAVLLIACANVTNLLLARALRRRREMSVRRAIGGSRARLAQQVFTETLVLAVLGGVAGLLGAQLAAGGLRALLIGDTDGWPVATDARTIAFVGALTLVIAFLAGVFPALHVGRGDLASSLKAGMRDGAYRQSRVRVMLLLVQTALSVVLLVGAGLFVRSLLQVRALRLGYDVDHLVYLTTEMRGVRLDAARASTLSDQLLGEARAIPGVASATVTITVPLLGGERRTLYVAGIDSVPKLGQFQLQAGSSDYFATLGTRILSGRSFSEQDRANTPWVAVVSQAMAKALWKNDNAIGKCFRIASPTTNCTTVIGIAENIKSQSLIGDGEFIYYLPVEQYVAQRGSLQGLEAFVRVNGRADDYTETLRSRLQRLMPGPSYVIAAPFHQVVDPAMRSWTSGARMFLAFGALAVIIAAIGLYAVIAFAVAQRTQELGVRLALGARPTDLLKLVIGEGVRVTVGGVAIGVAIALIAGDGISALLFEISPRDPLVYGIVAALLVFVGILASAIPASRAARVDPNVALRSD
jgi:predicted permease